MHVESDTRAACPPCGLGFDVRSALSVRRSRVQMWLGSARHSSESESKIVKWDCQTVGMIMT
jgi:hypothetical protein